MLNLCTCHMLCDIKHFLKNCEERRFSYFDQPGNISNLEVGSSEAISWWALQPRPPQLSMLTLRHLFLSAKAVSLCAACKLLSLCSWFLPSGKRANGDSEGGDTRTTHYTLEWPVPHKGSCGYSVVCGWNYDSEARRCICFLQWVPCFPHCEEALRGTGWRRERIGFGSGFQRLWPVGRWILGLYWSRARWWQREAGPGPMFITPGQPTITCFYL